MTNIFTNLSTLLNSNEEQDNNEYKEILGDIRLLIHETIDKIHDNSNKIIDELVKDIYNRIDLECDGHNLDKEKFYVLLKKLAEEIDDIYSDEQDKPRSSVDVFKYATTKSIANKINKGE